MPFDDHLADRIRHLVARRKGFAERKMFGGVCFFCNGNICVGVHEDALVVRLAKERHAETLAAQHTRPFDITRKVLKGWAMVEPAGVASEGQLKDWIDRAAHFARSLPPK